MGDEVNPDALKNLLEMGFDEDKAKEALAKSGNNPENALEYLVNKEEKQAQDDQDAAKNSNEVKVVRSYICTDTGRVFRTMRDAQLYAERTGNTNFEESDIEVPPLSEEEKKAKVAQLKEKIKEKRAQREANEKAEGIAKEAERRRAGQQMAEMREVMEKEKRIREIEKMKKEKEAERKHREELREKIAIDKAERAAQRARERGEDAKAAYDAAYEKEINKHKKTKKERQSANWSPEERMDKSISILKEFRAGGDGQKALKTIRKMMSNLLENPKEDKFRHINLGNPAFKKRVAGLKGGIDMFKSVGFEKVEEEDKTILYLSDDNYKPELLEVAIEKLDKVIET